MRNTRAMRDDGTVEISESVYRCLIGALKTIAVGNDACCAEFTRRGNRHGSSCAVAIARAAFQEANRLDAAPNSILDSPSHE